MKTIIHVDNIFTDYALKKFDHSKEDIFAIGTVITNSW
jgi:hypothetical protein